jgi:hypothetical protein
MTFNTTSLAILLFMADGTLHQFIDFQIFQLGLTYQTFLFHKFRLLIFIEYPFCQLPTGTFGAAFGGTFGDSALKPLDWEHQCDHIYFQTVFQFRFAPTGLFPGIEYHGKA